MRCSCCPLLGWLKEDVLLPWAVKVEGTPLPLGVVASAAWPCRPCLGPGRLFPCLYSASRIPSALPLPPMDSSKWLTNDSAPSSHSLVSLIFWIPCAGGKLRGGMRMQLLLPHQRLGASMPRQHLVGPQGTLNEGCPVVCCHVVVRGEEDPPHTYPRLAWKTPLSFPTDSPTGCHPAADLPSTPHDQPWALEMALRPPVIWG